ncbi:DUF1493 family protein [Siccibacter colletis]|uniref:DUF1493 family protein n=1 Tax=Siccibacter colletis TaxID=1505757 RepID=UPI0028BDA28D|nr:DUF1493 family protein [Siccibacter colletis]WNN47773.1 DUF1493 family protein [Siccibacter colletis]
MVKDEVVLAFFRHELPLMTTLTFRPIPVEMDTPLQAYAESDDIGYAIDKYSATFDVNVSNLDMAHYYPWKVEWFFRKWFTNKPLIQRKKPLTVRMFAESARAGRWLFD